MLVGDSDDPHDSYQNLNLNLSILNQRLYEHTRICFSLSCALLDGTDLDETGSALSWLPHGSFAPPYGKAGHVSQRVFEFRSAESAGMLFGRGMVGLITPR